MSDTAVSPNYGAIPISNAGLAVRRGTIEFPVEDAGSVIIAELRSSKTFVSGHANAAIAGLATKLTTGNHAVTQGAFFEAVDKVGWAGSIAGGGSNNFVEGCRTHGLVEALGGSAYGAVGFAGAVAGIQWKYLCGFEGDVSNSFSDMPVGMMNPNNFAASFIATSRGTKKVDAGYVINPFTTEDQRFQAGFLVSGATSTHTGFKHTGGGSIGIDLSSATLSYSAMRLPNNSPILARNAANTADIMFGYVGNDDIPCYGANKGVKLNLGLGIGDRVVTVGDINTAGAGFRVLKVQN
jgi:hypothetical protein